MGSGIEVSPDMDPGETLAHYGVKGMQWGRRKADDSGGSGESSGSAKKAKPTTAEVKTARRNLQKQAMQYHEAKDWAKSNTTRGSAERVLANEKVASLKADYLNNPDRITALYLTKGEKAVMGVIATVGLGAGTGAVAGNAATRAAQRKIITNRQNSGKYNR